MGANSTDSGNNTGLTFTAGGGIDYLNVSYINGTVVSTGYTVTADNGTYAVTGQSATLLRSKVLSGDFGSYTVTGQSATLLRSKVLSGDYGLYTLAGQDASIRRTRLFEANTGQYALTGQDAIITLGGSPIVVDEQLLIKLRSFTERRRF
jgi:phage gp45-like